jgi:hypothetical protein
MEKEIKYCRECGSELLQEVVYAGKTEVLYPDSLGGGYTGQLDSMFDEKTGKKNIATELKCPNWKHNWSKHDKIILYKDEYHYI